VERDVFKVSVDTRPLKRCFVRAKTRGESVVGVETAIVEEDGFKSCRVEPMSLMEVAHGSFFGSPYALASGNSSVVAVARVLDNMLRRAIEGGGLASLL
jgi:hypothetical protein